VSSNGFYTVSPGPPSVICASARHTLCERGVTLRDISRPIHISAISLFLLLRGMHVWPAHSTCPLLVWRMGSNRWDSSVYSERYCGTRGGVWSFGSGTFKPISRETSRCSIVRLARYHELPAHDPGVNDSSRFMI
jgi:hypothetical protein